MSPAPSPGAPWQTLSVEHRGATAWIRMQRPEVHNAFDAALVAELTAALAEVGADPAHCHEESFVLGTAGAPTAPTAAPAPARSMGPASKC